MINFLSTLRSKFEHRSHELGLVDLSHDGATLTDGWAHYGIGQLRGDAADWAWTRWDTDTRPVKWNTFANALRSQFGVHGEEPTPTTPQVAIFTIDPSTLPTLGYHDPKKEGNMINFISKLQSMFENRSRELGLVNGDIALTDGWVQYGVGQLRGSAAEWAWARYGTQMRRIKWATFVEDLHTRFGDPNHLPRLLRELADLRIGDEYVTEVHAFNEKWRVLWQKLADVYPKTQEELMDIYSRKVFPNCSASFNQAVLKLGNPCPNSVDEVMEKLDELQCKIELREGCFSCGALGHSVISCPVLRQ